MELPCEKLSADVALLSVQGLLYHSATFIQVSYMTLDCLLFEQVRVTTLVFKLMFVKSGMVSNNITLGI